MNRIERKLSLKLGKRCDMVSPISNHAFHNDVDGGGLEGKIWFKNLYFQRGMGGGERYIFGPFYISIFGTILDYVYFTSVLYGCLVLEKVTNILLAFFC